MQIVSAMLPAPPESQDRILTTANAVIVLDGASAFRPTRVSPGDYVDALGNAVQDRIASEPYLPLIEILADAISTVSIQLQLRPGSSPSSTVAIARERTDEIDFLVLGDTKIVTPSAVLCDARLDAVATKERRAYRDRLADGRGFDDEDHRVLLKRLQAAQAQARNAPYGYWIAEADRNAADHSRTRTMKTRDVPWVIVATDGMYGPFEHLNLKTWESLATAPPEGLEQILKSLDSWERYADPNGKEMPRAKRHDDKALAVMVPGAG